MQTQKIHWQVSLSNGDTITEGSNRTFNGVPLFAEKEGDLSPWRKLQAYIEENNLDITSLCLVTDDHRTFNLPAAGKNPKFRRFAMMDKPLAYRCERAVGTDRNKKGEIINEQDWFSIAVAVYNDFELQLWVDENDTRNCWVLAVPKS